MTTPEAQRFDHVVIFLGAKPKRNRMYTRYKVYNPQDSRTIGPLLS